MAKKHEGLEIQAKTFASTFEEACNNGMQLKELRRVRTLLSGSLRESLRKRVGDPKENRKKRLEAQIAKAQIALKELATAKESAKSS